MSITLTFPFTDSADYTFDAAKVEINGLRYYRNVPNESYKNFLDLI